jgi:hypothetical protein
LESSYVVLGDCSTCWDITFHGEGTGHHQSLSLQWGGVG